MKINLKNISFIFMFFSFILILVFLAQIREEGFENKNKDISSFNSKFN